MTATRTVLAILSLLSTLIGATCLPGCSGQNSQYAVIAIHSHPAPQPKEAQR